MQQSTRRFSWLSWPTQFTWLAWALAIFSLLVLSSLHSSVSGGVLPDNDPRFEIVMSGVVAFVVNLEMPMRDNSISLGYAVGLLTFLTLGSTSTMSFEALIVLGLGGLSGGALRAWWRYRESPPAHWNPFEVVALPLFSASQLVLSLAAGQIFYLWLDGELPLRSLHISDIGSVIALVIVSMGVYMGLYILALRIQHKAMPQDRLTIALSLGLPLPLVIAAALLFTTSHDGFIIMTAALIGLATASTELGRARLRYSQQVLEMQTLSSVSRAMRTNLDFATLGQTIYLQVAALLDPGYFWLVILDPARDDLTFPLVMWHGQNITLGPRPANTISRREIAAGEQIRRDLISQVVTSRAPLRLADHPQERAIKLDLIPPDPGISSWLGVPIPASDRALGAIIIASDNPLRAFTDHEQHLLSEIAGQASIAIENAQLYQRSEIARDRHMRQLAALSTINKELSSTLTMSSVFRLIIEGAVANTDSDNGILLLRPELGQDLRSVARIGTEQPDAEVIPQEVVSRVDNTGKPVRLVQGDRVMLGVPIEREYDVLGVILLESKVMTGYPPDDISFVTQLANQTMIAFDNIRLIEWMLESRNRLQVILDSMHDAVIMFETDGHVALANPRVDLLLGLDPNQIDGQALDTLLGRPDLLFAERIGFTKDDLCAVFERLKQGQQFQSTRHSYQLATPRQVFIDRSSVTVFDPNGGIIGLLMVFADATEERELAQTREDLSRMIVHDLRSPLTAISTSMKLLGEIATTETPLGRSIHRTTDVSQRALRKLLSLVDSLLDIAKMESGNMALEIDQTLLRPLAENVKLELSPLAEELNIRVELTVPPDLALPIDGHKIERVLLNLVDNALKYTPVDGVVQVRAVLEDGPMCKIEVVDTGPGIPDTYKVRIFDRFQQVENSKSHRRGTGLGLTFCRLTIEEHGGTIWIEDNPTGGSIFAFTLPANK